MHAENAVLHQCNEWISVFNGVNGWNAAMHRFNEWMFVFNGGNDLNSVNECVEYGLYNECRKCTHLQMQWMNFCVKWSEWMKCIHAQMQCMNFWV